MGQRAKLQTHRSVITRDHVPYATDLAYHQSGTFLTERRQLMKRQLEGRSNSDNKQQKKSRASPTSFAPSASTSPKAYPDEHLESSLNDSSSDDTSDDSSSEGSSSGSEEDQDIGTAPASVTFYTEENPPDGKLYWYWTQRYRMFSRYDEGVWMTDDSWFEVTPERIAEQIADKVLQGEKKKIIIDAFCGVGGNAIQFALNSRCSKVYAIDTNKDAIQCAERNAKIYGVSEKIEFIGGNCFQLLDKLREHHPDAVFLSPPWGGPGYRRDSVFDLESMEPYSASTIIKLARSITRNLALYIPRTSNLNQLAQLEEEGQLIEAVHYCLDRKSKAITAYFGNLSKHCRNPSYS